MERSATSKWATRKKKSKILTKVKDLLNTSRKKGSDYKVNVETRKTLLQQGVKEFKAGQVKEHLSNWNQITSDPKVLQNIALVLKYHLSESHKWIKFQVIQYLAFDSKNL